ncbi:MAG: ABC transporter ATP-binding protein [Oceanospirillaceae bacterium]|nr:ABC transporter ATP-binding protein [Oceanospirillaceae bacterium]
MSLQLQNLSFGYTPDRLILDDISLTFNPGCFYVILAKNGGGKTTLFNLIMRHLTPTQGSITLGPNKLHSLSQIQQAQAISLLSQSMPLPDHMSVSEMVMQGRYCYQSFWSRYSVKDTEITYQAMQKMDITQLANCRLDALSGGQQQRARMAMLLAQQTDIVLLDEPTSHLDLKHQYLLLDMGKALVEQGKTVIAILHDMTQAALYADHVIVLNGQKIYAQGPPNQVINNQMMKAVFGVNTTRVGNDRVGVHVPVHLLA